MKLKARTTEKFETIAIAEYVSDITVNESRLKHARVVGPPVTLAYMGDDKNYVGSF